MAKYKIGITERGDAGLDVSWVGKLDAVDGAVVITKCLSPACYDKIHLAPDDALRKCITILNPLGEDTSIMRTTAIPSML